ncbi:MAG: type II secretion system F family protein [Herbinix sp.]|nr:type II secretion system F family protein [Herbinix sp.]
MISDYNKYQLSWKENIKYSLQGTAVAIILGTLFYRSILGFLMLSPLVYFYRRSRVRGLINDRKWKLNLEFRDGMVALSAALQAGYSAENAFEEVCKDLRQIYLENSMVIREFSYITNQIHMNITVEKALSDFGERTGIEDILSFSEVFNTAKRTGGDLINVIKITCNIISDKIEVKKEIITLITAKRLEANIMKLTPLLILIYLSVSSPGFLDPLYHNLLGIVTMTIFMAFYLGAFLIIDKIIAIEV